MSTQQGLAERVAALRQRLEAISPPAADADPASSATEQVEQLRREIQHLETQGTHLEARIAELCPELALDDPFPPLPRQLAWKTRRLLLRGRDILDGLRSLRELMGGDEHPFAAQHRRIMAMARLTLECVRGFPESTSEQLRLGEGLDGLFRLIEQQLSALRTHVHRRQRDEARVESVAHLYQALVQGRPALWRPFEELSQRLLEEAERGVAIAWLPAPPTRPEAWAAAHALHVAQVVARMVVRNAGWTGRPAEAVLAALVCDAGMAALPAELLAQAGPLNEEQRRQVETHVGRSAEAAVRLMPGASWLVSAVRGHHERLHGTGYPAGAQGLQISPLARLLAVADTYAALCSPRPYRPALAPRAALTETLMEAEKGRLDPAQAELLLSLSFYPVGTIVELSDGELAHVVAVHPLSGNLSLAARPVVQLLDCGEERLSAPEFVDLSLSEGRHVVRSLTPEETRERLGWDQSA
jgi:hypothetical protein